MLLQPKNWAHFQHYKDRCPPWIKLHRDLLNNRDFMRLPIASKALAPMLWLLASESKDGSFDGSLDELVFRLHITEKEYNDGIKPLIDKGFFVSDSEVLADCLQTAIPERETETKKETKKKSATNVACPDSVNQQVWNDWLIVRKGKGAKSLTETAWTRFTNQVEKAGWGLEQAISHCCLKNWVSFEADWVAPKQQFANKYDVAHITTPPPPNQDAALRKIEEDSKRAAKPNADVQAKIAELLKGRVQ